MVLIMEGSDPKWFQENMGRGGAIPLGKKSEPKQPNSSGPKPEEKPQQSRGGTQ